MHVSHHPEPLTHIPPHPIPLGCPRAQALSALDHVSNLHQSSILHMVICMFQCYSLKSSHPHLLPHSPKVCSLHLCLFCCLAYRVISSTHRLCVYSTAWEYCFFIVHLVRAFGDAYKLMDVRRQVSRLSCFYTIY